MHEKTVYVGVDVSKAFLDVATVPDNKSARFVNDEQGVRQIAEFLKGFDPRLVVLESTGGLENLAAMTLASKGFAVAVINPRQARDYAKAIGRLAKTDAIDAHVLARFGEAVKPPVRRLKDEEAQELSALASRRSQIVEMIVAEKNRLGSARSKRVRKEINAHIEWLSKRLDVMDKDIEDAIQKSPVWKAKDDLLKSVPGVGSVVSLTLIAMAPELGSVNRKEAAALVGVAPMNRDSGKQTGHRCAWGGRANVRATLYMAALSASRQWFNSARTAYPDVSRYMPFVLQP